MAASLTSGGEMYTARGTLDRAAAAERYAPLVRRLAAQMIARLPANVELDDLIQVGMIGLSDALSRFDNSQGVQFETFATQRIRGAMLDELRGNDWMSRGDRRHQRSIETAVHKLEQRHELVERQSARRRAERRHRRRRHPHPGDRKPCRLPAGRRLHEHVQRHN